jgi:hypothetical protein
MTLEALAFSSNNYPEEVLFIRAGLIAKKVFHVLIV